MALTRRYKSAKIPSLAHLDNTFPHTQAFHISDKAQAARAGHSWDYNDGTRKQWGHIWSCKTSVRCCSSVATLRPQSASNGGHSDSFSKHRFDFRQYQE
jgi:hypothetical protein